jgi:hypothetical protein
MRFAGSVADLKLDFLGGQPAFIDSDKHAIVEVVVDPIRAISLHIAFHVHEVSNKGAPKPLLFSHPQFGTDDTDAAAEEKAAGEAQKKKSMIHVDTRNESLLFLSNEVLPVKLHSGLR